MNTAQIIELEATCTRLRQQLAEQQLETQKWKDAYAQVEKDLKTLQGRRSPSIMTKVWLGRVLVYTLYC